MKMKTIKQAVVAAVGALAFGSAQAQISWDLSPDAINSDAFGTTVITGSNAINFADNGNQTAGIYGAGFTVTNASSFSMDFDHDLYTWDSYVAPVNPLSDGTGYFDGFIVTISTLGYYWDISPSDPQVNSASTWVWGGQSWSDGVLENNVCNVGCTQTVFASSGGDATNFYVSIVLDTASSPQSDDLHPSWGSFHVTPIPEPEIYAMMAAGLGLMGFVGRRRRKQGVVV
jgi:hypothetical protein